MLTYYAVSSLLSKSIVPMAQRQYEAVVFGATGYTGKYTAEHIATNLPTDFEWAIAGRSERKLKQLAEELRRLNPDRKQPKIEIATLDKDSLERLAKKTKVFISTVGPYHKYGTPVVAACAETGTNYLDVTGETPWVYDIIQKYHKTAQKTGAIMIPQIGVESAPADLLAYGLVQYIRKSFGTPTAEVIQSTHTLVGGVSGGTLATVLTLFDTYGLLHLAKSGGRWATSAVPAPRQQYASKSIWERLTGMRAVKGLPGPLTDSIQASADIPLVHRSWSLFDGGKFYGPNFRLNAYMRVKSAFTAVAVHYGLAMGLMVLLFPPVRWMLKRFVYQPGDGPSREESKAHHVEWRSVGIADEPGSANPRQAIMDFKFDGSMYQLTGIFLAEAAITIARDKTKAHSMGGGILTPATLGDAFLGRLNQAGIRTSVKTL